MNVTQHEKLIKHGTRCKMFFEVKKIQKVGVYVHWYVYFLQLKHAHVRSIIAYKKKKKTQQKMS